MKQTTLILVFLLNAMLLNIAAAGEFPGRIKYPEVKVIEKIN